MVALLPRTADISATLLDSIALVSAATPPALRSTGSMVTESFKLPASTINDMASTETL